MKTYPEIRITFEIYCATFCKLRTAKTVTSSELVTEVFARMAEGRHSGITINSVQGVGKEGGKMERDSSTQIVTKGGKRNRSGKRWSENNSVTNRERDNNAKVTGPPRDKVKENAKKKDWSSKQSGASKQPIRPNPKVAPLPTVQSDELAQQLVTGTYECMVCYNSVKSDHRVWSCSSCFHIFHLRCITKWAKTPQEPLDVPGTFKA